MLFSEQFDLWAGHSTDCTLIEIVCRMANGFMESNYTIGVFIDLLKVFDAVNQKLLIEKLEIYGVKDENLQWF